MHTRQSFSFIILGALAGLLVLTGWSLSERRAAASFAATIIVNDAGDTELGGDGKCTLREAITNANSNAQLPGSVAGDCDAGMPGLDNIRFNLGAGTPVIAPTSGLPGIQEPIDLDGNSGGATRVELNGAGAGIGIDGLGVFGGDSAIRSLVINRFTGMGIVFVLNGNNTLKNCYIGTNAAGTVRLGNNVGVFILDVANNTIGGTAAGERNLISGNGVGVEINGVNATGNRVLGNFIGTEATGTLSLGNLVNGVSIRNAPDNTIGGAAPGERNVISGNGQDGVNIFGSTATGNRVLGNFIGADLTGTLARGNSRHGVSIQSANNVIGGAAAGEGNLISGNNSLGIQLFTASAANNRVLGNFIGVNASGTADLGNRLDGVNISNAPNNLIGGAAAGERNLISGNGNIGVAITGASATGNRVRGNFIGANASGTASIVNGDGVAISSAANNTIGGTAAGEGNLISGSNRDGVRVSGASSTGNKVLGNSITNNPVLGLNLFGNFVVDPNDAGDADTGPNNLQNFPVLTCAFSANGQTIVQGALNSLASRSFRLEFFANDVCNPSGHGEGQTFLGFTNVTTNGAGDATFDLNFATALTNTQTITATTTLLDVNNDPVETSEFSQCLAVLVPALTINDVSIAEGHAGTANAVFTVTLAGAANICLPVTVSYATANGTATTADGDYSAVPLTLLTFNPGETSKQVLVSVTGDTKLEPHESFFVNLSNATNAVISRSQGLGTILDDELKTAQIGGKLADPLVCTGPGGVLNVTATVTNPNAVTVDVVFNAVPAVPGQLFVIDGSCMATGQLSGSCQTPSNMQAGFNGQLAAGQTVTISYRVQVANNAAPGAQLCMTSTASFTFVNNTVQQQVTACGVFNCPVDPAVALSANAALSDSKPGSVLIYNVYTSAVDAARQNTRLNITNTHQRLTAYVHLFFVDGLSCAVADSYVCLTGNQTASFLASDLDPGTTGFFIAVATNNQGCPINFNYLIGDEFVKFTSGHAANLAAESIAAIAGGLPACDANSVEAQLNFNGLSYNALPRALAASNLPSRGDGNDTLLIVDRIGGHLGTGAATIGTLIGVLYDDAEHPFSFSLAAPACQPRGSLTNDRPRTTPRYDQLIPPGRTGWLKIYGGTDVGIIGAPINRNASALTNSSAFNQGHKLTLTTTASVTIPVFPPTC